MTLTLPHPVVIEMARRRRRFHYYLWHRLRSSWELLTEPERRAIRDIDPGWVPPRPALDARRRPLRDNDSGEDFLFLHRRMLEQFDVMLAQAGDGRFPRTRGWARLPPPDDPEDPIPEFPESELEEVKSAAYYEQALAPLERRFTDEGYLRGVTLGRLGSDIEFTVHNEVHVRWAAPSAVGYRPPTATERGIEERWDDPAYTYLGDTYASHLNAIFWKLHGWVSDRVEDWRRAHGIAGEIAWRGTWVGPLEAAGGPGRGRPGGADDAEEYRWRRIDQIISASGAAGFDGYFRPRLRPPF